MTTRTDIDGLVSRLDGVIAMNRQDGVLTVPRDLLLECRAAVIARNVLAQSAELPASYQPPVPEGDLRRIEKIE